MDFNQYVIPGYPRYSLRWEQLVKDAPRALRSMADFSTRHAELKRWRAAASVHLKRELEELLTQVRQSEIDEIAEVACDWPDDNDREVQLQIVEALHREQRNGYRSWADQIEERLDKAVILAMQPPRKRASRQPT